jgi:hypothetical protein
MVTAMRRSGAIATGVAARATQGNRQHSNSTGASKRMAILAIESRQVCQHRATGTRAGTPQAHEKAAGLSPRRLGASLRPDVSA